MKKFSALAIFMSLVMLLSSCEEARSEPASSSQAIVHPTVSIGVSLFDLDDNYISLINAELQEIDYDDNTLKIEIRSSEGDSDLQLSEVINLISMGVDVIAVNLVDVENAVTICNHAKAAQIDVVFFGAKPPLDSLAEFDNYIWLGTSEANSGSLQAEMAITDFNNGNVADKNGDGVMQYLLLKGEEENPITTQRSEALTAALSAAGAVMLAEAETDWSAESAMMQSEEWLNANMLTQADVVFCNSDGIALGVIELLKQTEESVAVYGIDAIPQAIDIIDDGILMGTVYNDPYLMAEAVAMVSANIAREYQPTEYTRLTADSPTEITIPVGEVKPKI